MQTCLYVLRRAHLQQGPDEPVKALAGNALVDMEGVAFEDPLIASLGVSPWLQYMEVGAPLVSLMMMPSVMILLCHSDLVSKLACVGRLMNCFCWYAVPTVPLKKLRFLPEHRLCWRPVPAFETTLLLSCLHQACTRSCSVTCHCYTFTRHQQATALWRWGGRSLHLHQ